MKRIVSGVVTLIVLMSFVAGCSFTRKVAFPPADELYITCGENTKENITKGSILHATQAPCIPIPILGLIGWGMADPQKVFDEVIKPEVKTMGGDALICANVQYEPGPGFFGRLLGIGCLFSTETTALRGMVVKRPNFATGDSIKK
jgi:hypothetical protein